MKKIIAIMLVMVFGLLLPCAAFGEAGKLVPVGYRQATSLFGKATFYVSYQDSANGRVTELQVDQEVYNEVVADLSAASWRKEAKRWYLPWTWAW